MYGGGFAPPFFFSDIFGATRSGDAGGGVGCGGRAWGGGERRGRGGAPPAWGVRPPGGVRDYPCVVGAPQGRGPPPRSPRRLGSRRGAGRGGAGRLSFAVRVRSLCGGGRWGWGGRCYTTITCVF